MSEYVGLIDFFILGALLAGLTGLIVKLFKMPEFMGIVLFLAISGLVLYTDEGKAFAGKIAIFDKS